MGKAAHHDRCGAAKRPLPWIPWFEAVASLFYPDLCQLCNRQRATRAEGYVCWECRDAKGGVRLVQPPFCSRCGLIFDGAITTSFECSNCRDVELHFSFARAAVVATPLLLDVIHRYKYRRALWFEPFLAGLLVRTAAPELDRNDWDLLVPVPLHPKKQWNREFNQAERLAQHLSKATSIPMNRDLLMRTEFTRTQTMLSRDERLSNVRGAFALRKNKDLDGTRIVLVDDVLTTGATTGIAARALLDGGASNVCVWTVARGV